MAAGKAAATPGRTILIGSNSQLWRTLANDPRLATPVEVSMGHLAAATFEFRSTDCVWVFSYSRKASENLELLAGLQARGVAQIRYVSSSSTIVCQVTRCYEYPRLKAEAEAAVLAIPGGTVLTLGLVFGDPPELPGGDNVATSFRELADFMCHPEWPDGSGRRKLLFNRVPRPFSGHLEAMLYRIYDRLLRACGRYPCLLRPVDLALRCCGYRWYGYVRLSNRLWYSTISS